MQTRRSFFVGLTGISTVTALSGWPLKITSSGGAQAKGQVPHRRNTSSENRQSTGGLATTPSGSMMISARWACVINSTTHAVLLEKNSDEKMPPSSLTKMMTAYVVFTFLASGHIQLDQHFPVSNKAWRMQGSKMFVPNRGNVSVHDLIQGMLIQSGNDACIVLAEGIAGSEERFVSLMNQEVERLGLTGSHFANATGWPADQHYMTARDVAHLAEHLVNDFPQYYHFFGGKDFTYNHIHQGNRNVLVDKGLADGLKTGHTDAGGFGLCASSLRDGTRVVVVINGTSSSNERAHEGERLMSWAFENFETVTLFKKGQVVEEHAAVWMGEQSSVPLVAAQNMTFTLPRGWRERTQISVDYPSPIPAPLIAGQQCGHVSVSLPGQAPKTQSLLIGQSVGQLGIIGRTMARLGYGPSH